MKKFENAEERRESFLLSIGVFWRVKENVAKQLIKNKEMLAETVVAFFL
jgi:hypothetical protein